MSADGNTIAVRAKDPPDVTIWKYDADTNSWAQKGGPLNQAPDYRYQIGLALSISSNGERIVLGNRGAENKGVNGYARVYQYDGIDGDGDNINGWTQLGSDIYTPVAEDAHFRNADIVVISADGTKIVIGDPLKQQFLTYKLSDSGTDWTFNAKVTHPWVELISMSNGGNRIVAGGGNIDWFMCDFDGNLIYQSNTSVCMVNGSCYSGSTRGSLAISGDGKSVAFVNDILYRSASYGRDGRGAIFVYDFGDTCPADYSSTGALANPSASVGKHCLLLHAFFFCFNRKPRVSYMYQCPSSTNYLNLFLQYRCSKRQDYE